MRGRERASRRCEGQWFGWGEVEDNRGVVERMVREANEILWEGCEEERGITHG